MTAGIWTARLRVAALRFGLWMGSPLRPAEGANTNFLRDASRAWRMFAFARSLAYHRAIARNRQTYLGALWLPLGFVLFAGGISLLWAQIFDRPLNTYLPYVTFGLFVWNLVLGSLTDGARVMQENRNLILQSNTPLLIYPLTAMLKQSIMAAYNIPFVILVAVAFSPAFDPAMLLALPGLMLVWILGLAVCVSLSILCTYLPDLSEIIASGLRFVFFFTPILWLPSTREGLHHIWMWNPFFYLIEVVRSPLSGNHEMLPLAFAVTGALAIAAWVVAIFVYRRFAGAVPTRLGG